MGRELVRHRGGVDKYGVYSQEKGKLTTRLTLWADVRADVRRRRGKG
jgi:hypothetical protein